MAPVDVSDRAVRALLRRWFRGETVCFSRMGRGVSTPVYRVTVRDVESYLRLAEEPGERRDGEVRAHELALAAGIAVPNILRWEGDPPELDRSATLTATMPGVPLLEFDGDVGPAAMEAGRQLARLNAILVSGWGWIAHPSGADRHLVAEHQQRTHWVEEYIAAVDTVSASSVLAPGLTETLQTTVSQWADRPAGGVSWLAHGDFDASHIYVDPATGAYQGIIDLGEARGADRSYDLGHALLHAGSERDAAIARGLVTGYREVILVNDDEVHLQAIAIATRALAIQLSRVASSYRALLINRLEALLTSHA